MYAVMGATGNTGHSVANALLSQGQKVRALGRTAARLQPLAAKDAEPLVADVADTETLTNGFKGAKAVYVMVPPNVTSQNYGSDQDSAIDAIASAVKNSGVEFVVALSSIGADKPSGTGPVTGLYNLEQKLNAIAAPQAVLLGSS